MHTPRTRIAALGCVVGFAFLAVSHSSGHAARLTERISVGLPESAQGDDMSFGPDISADGRFVTFESMAATLVSGDTNAVADVFVHDLATGATTRVSTDSAGNQGDARSYLASISADGRFVAFVSRASNLVPGDSNGCSDVFVHDRQTGQTTRVSVDSGGGQGNGPSETASISDDGSVVAFSSEATNMVPGDTNGRSDVFVHDRLSGETTRVSVDSAGNQADQGAWWPALSADGRFVAFDSLASNLAAGDANGAHDVFVHDRQTGSTGRVSVDSTGNGGNAQSGNAVISADGRLVAFSSHASNLVEGDANGAGDVFVHDRLTAETSRVSVDSAGNQGNDASGGPLSLSPDGRYVAFASAASNLVAGDMNQTGDIFLHDRLLGQTAAVSVGSSGGMGLDEGGGWQPSVSADGRLVAFDSTGALVPGDTNSSTDVFVRDPWAGTTTRVSLGPLTSQANGTSYMASLAADGMSVAFLSHAGNLVAGDTNGQVDVFVHDRRTGRMTRTSVDSLGNQANGSSVGKPGLSGNGRFVAFSSLASNLVAGDTNGAEDVFVHDRGTGTTVRVSVSSAGLQANGDSYAPAISADGRFVTFSSWASNLVPGDSNGLGDIFIHELETGRTLRVNVDSQGNEARNGSSYESSLSADGRFVAFTSEASNLVPGDTTSEDVFVHDRETGRTEKVSVNYPGSPGYGGQYQAPSISADGRFVAFPSTASTLVPGDTNDKYDVFVRDRLAGVTTRVSVDSSGGQGNANSFHAALSANGRVVLFRSWADNLVPGDTNGVEDLFAHDLATGQTTRVSVDSLGNQGFDFTHSTGLPVDGAPGISSDGGLMAFASGSSLVPDKVGSFFDVFVHGATERLAFFDDFGDGSRSGDPDWTEVRGDWTVKGQSSSLVSPATAAALIIVQDPQAAATFLPAGLQEPQEAAIPLRAGSVEVQMRLIRLPTLRSGAGVVFGYRDARHYRYVAVRPGRLLIGQVGGAGADREGTKVDKALPLAFGTWYPLRVEFRADGLVKVYRRSRLIGRYRFNGAQAGGVGLLARRAVSRFDDFRVWDASIAP